MIFINFILFYFFGGTIKLSVKSSPVWYPISSLYFSFIPFWLLVYLSSPQDWGWNLETGDQILKYGVKWFWFWFFDFLVDSFGFFFWIPWTDILNFLNFLNLWFSLKALLWVFTFVHIFVGFSITIFFLGLHHGLYRIFFLGLSHFHTSLFSRLIFF